MYSSSFFKSLSLENFINSHIMPRCIYTIYKKRYRFDHLNNPQHDAYLRMQQYRRTNARTPPSSQGTGDPANRIDPTRTSTPAAGDWGGGGFSLG
jgi:hypothetical protein